MRLLSVIRLSVDTDETTSPSRQRAKNQGYADLNDHTIIGEAQDLDVSARKVDPWKRPGLGPWLNDADKRALWDGLIFSRQDRIARSSLDWHKLVKWLDENGKTMICLDPMADLTTASGRFVAGVIAGFGEMEADMIAARVKDAVTALRAAGQYSGGSCPFGLMPVRLPNGKGWGYILDPEFAPVVAEMAERFLSGQSLGQIVNWLNDTGTPTSQDVLRRRQNIVRREQGKPEKPERGTKWRHSTVQKVLASKTIIGLMTHDGAALLDNDGMPIQRCDPIISAEDFEAIQKVFESNSDRTGPRVNSAPLLRIAFCSECGGVMHLNCTKTSHCDLQYRYYECANARSPGTCATRKIRAELVETELKAKVLNLVGDKPMTKKVVTPASDNSVELAEIAKTIEAWEDKAVLGENADNVMRIIDKLKARQAALSAIGTREERVEWVATPETVSEHWESVQRAGDLNTFLREKGVTIHVRRATEDDPAKTGSLVANVHLADLDAIANA